MHSHLLPGIDDGAPTIADSIRLIRGLYDLGYRHLITTPHVFKEYYPNTPAIIREKLTEVQAALKEEGINITIEAAAEYYLDEHFEVLMQNDDLLTFGRRHVLIEMSFYAPYPRLHETIFQLCTKGYKPILAHPERYTYYATQFEQYEQIKNYGCALQINWLSLNGHYGKVVKDLARKLREKQWVDFIGTEMHHDQHLQGLGRLTKSDEWQNLLSKQAFQNSVLIPADTTLFQS
ncbi:MAG: hypothetical protein IT269_13250 [Saprospiraceae bacterium]|nr:hypothetical protein [Saprospiraceae bacterium]